MNPIIIAPIVEIVKELIDLIPNKNRRDEAAAKLNEMVLKGEIDSRQGQIDTNKIEAGHRSVFVAGWRPFIGWVGGTALAWTFVLRPMVSYCLTLAGIETPLPDLMDAENLMELVFVLLGVSSLRTFEKYKGVTHK